MRQFLWLCEGLLIGTVITVVVSTIWILITIWKERDL